MRETATKDMPGQWLDTGWIPPNRKLSLADWGAAVEKLAAVNDVIHFWIGDLINYGERKYGETYAQWLDLFAYSTVSRDAWVCREIPRKIRRSPFGPNKVPFSTHVVLAPRRYGIEEKDWWLQLCADERWSGERLKVELTHHAALIAGEYDYLIDGTNDFIRIDNFDNGRDGPSADGSDSVMAGAGRTIACPHCGGLVPLPLPQPKGEAQNE